MLEHVFKEYCVDHMRAFAIAALLCGGIAGEDGTNSCGLYLAKSTIPGAGLGVYTGVDLESKF